MVKDVQAIASINMSDGKRCPSNSLSLSNTMKYMHIKNINGCFNGAKMWKMDHRFLISDPDVSKNES